MMARAVEQITTTGGVEIKEDARNDDNLLLETGLEEVEAIGDGARQTLEVKPQVESTVWHILNHEAHITQALNNVISLVLFMKMSSQLRKGAPFDIFVLWTYSEVALECLHFLANKRGLEHGNGSLLKWNISSTVKVGAARTDPNRKTGVNR
jgi:hypothetical protein